MSKQNRDRDRAMVASYAKRQGRGELLEVVARPRDVPDVFHFVTADRDDYVIGWRETGLTIYVPGDVMQGIISAALVAPAIGQVDASA